MRISKNDLKNIIRAHHIWLTSHGAGGGKANLSYGDLRHVCLRQVDLRCVNLRGASLRDADLRSTDLRSAYLREADLCGADLREADLCGADLREADLRDANLRDANLRDAALCGADLCDADLRDTNLRDADLRSANLRDANLRGADLRGARLYGAVLCGTRLPANTFVIYGERYYTAITSGEVVQVGPFKRTAEQWRNISRDQAEKMDGRVLVDFIPRLIDILDLWLGKGARPDWLTEDDPCEKKSLSDEVLLIALEGI